MKSGSTPASWLHTPYLSVALQYEVVAADILKAKPDDLDELEESDHRRATEELSERSAVVVRQKEGLQAAEGRLEDLNTQLSRSEADRNPHEKKEPGKPPQAANQDLAVMLASFKLLRAGLGAKADASATTAGGLALPRTEYSASLGAELEAHAAETKDLQADMRVMDAEFKSYLDDVTNACQPPGLVSVCTAQVELQAGIDKAEAELAGLKQRLAGVQREEEAQREQVRQPTKPVDNPALTTH
jgi:hypothetical protein